MEAFEISYYMEVDERDENPNSYEHEKNKRKRSLTAENDAR